jgi:hypothetical protein
MYTFKNFPEKDLMVSPASILSGVLQDDSKIILLGLHILEEPVEDMQKINTSTIPVYAIALNITPDILYMDTELHKFPNLEAFKSSVVAIIDTAPSIEDVKEFNLISFEDITLLESKVFQSLIRLFYDHVEVSDVNKIILENLANIITVHSSIKPKESYTLSKEERAIEYLMNKFPGIAGLS